MVAMNLARPGLSFAPPFGARHVTAATLPTCGVTCDRSTSRCFSSASSSATALRAAEASPGSSDGADKDDEIDRLVGIEEFRAEQAEREAAAAAVAAAVAAAGVGTGVGLGLEGAIFPSDAFPGSPGTEDITLQGTKLENGQPEAMIGFWKVGAVDDMFRLFTHLDHVMLLPEYTNTHNTSEHGIWTTCSGSVDNTNQL